MLKDFLSNRRRRKMAKYASKEQATIDKIKAAAPMSPEDEVKAGLLDVAKASKRLAKALDRRSKFTRRMIDATAPVTLFALFFYFTWLGVDIQAGDGKGVVTDLLFILAFGLMLLGRVLDMMREAREGAALRHETDRKADAEEREAELERAREEGRKEAMADAPLESMADLPEVLHGIMLNITLKKIIGEVMHDVTQEFGGHQAAKKAGFKPTPAHAREIERRFEERTGYTAKLTWVGSGWDAEIDADHDDSNKSQKRHKLIRKITEAFKEDDFKPTPKKPGSDDKKKPKKEGKN